jgi:hypothetical protein
LYQKGDIVQIIENARYYPPTRHALHGSFGVVSHSPTDDETRITVRLDGSDEAVKVPPVYIKTVVQVGADDETVEKYFADIKIARWSKGRHPQAVKTRYVRKKGRKKSDEFFEVHYEDQEVDDMSAQEIYSGAMLFQTELNARAAVPDSALLRQLTASYEACHQETKKEETDNDTEESDA